MLQKYLVSAKWAHDIRPICQSCIVRDASGPQALQQRHGRIEDDASLVRVCTDLHLTWIEEPNTHTLNV